MFSPDFVTKKKKFDVSRRVRGVSVVSDAPAPSFNVLPNSNAKNNRTICCNVACCDSQANVYLEDGPYDPSPDVVARSRKNLKRF